MRASSMAERTVVTGSGEENVVIRPATPADVPAIVRLIEGLADYERLRNQCHASEEALRDHLFGERPSAEVLIAERGAKIGAARGVEPVAFALFFYTFSTFRCAPTLYLEDLFVIPQARREGIGSAMLRRLAALAVKRGCTRFEWSVLDWNQPAIDFYVKFGARVMSDWRICRLDGETLLRAAGPADV